MHARVTCGFQHGSVLDDIGTASLKAAADLSSLQFREWDKPLIQIRPARQDVLARPCSPVVRRRGRGIPLSPAVAYELHQNSTETLDPDCGTS
jgi:hypothetical protein